MDEELLGILCCPDCRYDLTLASQDKGEAIETGTLTCPKCSRVYPIVRGIPRFVKADDYLRNFGMEWTIHAKTAFDSSLGKPVSEYMFQTRIGFDPGSIEGQLVLDAGCGSGRLLDVVRRHGGKAVGLDYTVAIDEAAKNLWPDRDVRLVQGDILKPPFKPDVFDYAFSNGVLHHTPDPPRAFSCVAALVKPGGMVGVWVYPDEGVLGRVPNRTAALYRLVTTRIPLPVLYKMCKSMQEHIAFPDVIYENFFDVDQSYAKGYRNPRQALYLILPFWSFAPFKDWRIMDTFDFLSPKYKFAYSYSQVVSWFRANGFVDVERLPFPVAVKGRRKGH
ncbi:MAG: methyltransferase domain-containing protein [Nitrososphaerales archaeon]